VQRQASELPEVEGLSAIVVNLTYSMDGTYKYPDLWPALAAWVPVTDLRSWYQEHEEHRLDLEAVCGGPPGASPDVDFEYLRRSPRTFITNLAQTHVLLAHGDKDPLISVEQSWETFRRLDKAAYGLDWCSQFARPSQPPTELHLVTVESKSYYWVHLQVGDPGRLGRCVVKLSDDELSVTTENLVRVGLELAALPLPDEGGLWLTVTNPEELRLDLGGLTPGAELNCEAGWTQARVPTQAETLELTVAPSTEARTCHIDL